MDLHSWKNRCVLGFSRMSASAERITGRNAAGGTGTRRPAGAPVPPRRRTRALGVGHDAACPDLRAPSSAAPNAMGTAASVATRPCVARSSTSTRPRAATPASRRRRRTAPPAKRTPRGWRGCHGARAKRALPPPPPDDAHRAGSQRDARRRARSRATERRESEKGFAPSPSPPPPPPSPCRLRRRAMRITARPGSCARSVVHEAATAEPMRAASARRSARRAPETPARRRGVGRARRATRTARPRRRRSTHSTAPAGSNRRARQFVLRETLVAVGLESGELQIGACAADHRRSGSSAAPRAPAWSGPASGARCASSAATNTLPSSPSVSSAPASSAATGASVHASASSQSRAGRAGDAHAEQVDALGGAVVLELGDRGRRDGDVQ